MCDCDFATEKNITLSLAMPAISNNKIRISLTVFIFIYSFTVTIVYCTDPNYSFEINRELSRENYKVFERTVLWSVFPLPLQHLWWSNITFFSIF